MTEPHFYEPKAGHRLPHDPFNAIVGPRPIGWISSRGADGSVNLAPYSFFNAFNYTPPLIGFSSTSPKDTLKNCHETGEFVWNIVTRPIAEAMNATSIAAPYGTDEFALAGLTPIPSRLVNVPRVAESPVHFECKVCDIYPLRGADGQPAGAWLVVGEVVGVHIDPALLKDGLFDTFGAQIVLRAGGPTAYGALSQDARFDLRRPTVS